MRHVRPWAPAILIALSTLSFGCGEAGPRVAVILSETGELGIYGKEVRRGIELAHEEIQAQGGFDGEPLELVFHDDRSSPEVAEQLARTLIEEEKFRLLVGGTGSDATLAIAPIAEQNETVLLSPSASAPAITDAGAFVFRNYPSDVLEGTSMADFARDRGLERVVVISQGNAWGEGLTGVFRSRFDSRRRTTEVLQLDAGADLPALVEQVKGMEPDGVYLVTYADATGELLPLIRAAGIDAVIMGTSSLRPQVVEGLGEMAEGLVLTRPEFDGASEENGVRAFVEAFRRKFGSDPDIYSAHGYDALMILWTAMKEAQSADAEDVTRALHKIEGYEGAAGLTTFDDKGDVVRYPRLFVVQGGATVPYDAESGAAPGAEPDEAPDDAPADGAP
jgi:branched-chain amino acid transport system substrate-binding protein